MKLKITLFLALAIALLIWGYFGFFKQDEEIIYITQKAEFGDITKRVEAVGEIYATELVAVGAQVGGEIKKLYVKLGDVVKKGDMIAEIDSRSQQNTVDNRKAQLDIYEASLDSANIALQSANAELKRQQGLKRSGATSTKEFQNAKQNAAAAKARVAELKAQIKQAKIALSTALIDLGYTKITAPMDGTIVSVRIEQGQTINSVQSAPTLVNIADLSEVKMKIQISEGDITKIRPGAKVRYTILSEPSRSFEAKIDSIDPGLTTLSDGSYSSSGTGSSSAVYYYAQCLIKNEDKLLRIGMSTQNSIDIASASNAIIVPTLAIKTQKGKKFIQVLKDGKPQKREITTGISDSLSTQVLSGVSQGEEVITASGTKSEIDSMVASAKR